MNLRQVVCLVYLVCFVSFVKKNCLFLTVSCFIQDVPRFLQDPGPPEIGLDKFLREE